MYIFSCIFTAYCCSRIYCTSIQFFPIILFHISALVLAARSIPNVCFSVHSSKHLAQYSLPQTLYFSASAYVALYTFPFLHTGQVPRSLFHFPPSRTLLVPVLIHFWLQQSVGTLCVHPCFLHMDNDIRAVPIVRHFSD
jgi:hypothetical protein